MTGPKQNDPAAFRPVPPRSGAAGKPALMTALRAANPAPRRRPPGPFDPSADPTCTLWLKSPLGVAPGGGSANSWTSQVPPRVYSGTAGLSADLVTTDGVSQNLGQSTGSFADLVTASAFSIYLVMKFNALTAPLTSFAGFDAGGHAAFSDGHEMIDIGAGSDAGGTAFFAVKDATNVFTHVTKPITAGALHVLSARLGGGQIEFSVDGGAPATSAAPDVGYLGYVPGLGWVPGWGDFANAAFAQVAVFNAHKSAAEDAAIVASLKAEYGI